MEESTPKKSIPTGLIAGLAAAGIILAAAAGYSGLCAWVQGNDQLLPGAVAVDDKGEAVADLGKLTQEDALKVVSDEMGQRLDSRTLTLLYGEGQQVELTGELMDCSPEMVVQTGMSVKEDTPFWMLGALWMGMAQEPVELSLSAAAFTPQGEIQAQRVIHAIAEELYAAPVDFTYELGEEEVVVTPGSDGREVDADALLDEVEEALAQGLTELRVEPQSVSSAQLTGKVLNDLVYVAPKPAGVDENGKLTPAVIGRSVNEEEAQSLLDAAEPGESVAIPLEFTPPGVSGDESMYYKDLLSTVTTNMDGVATRSFNVNRAAEFCNGKVLQPGEVFSYLGTIGDPSTANGYQPSTGYQNGLTVSMDGGGVCQVSSSLYYCAVYANLEIVNRANHAFSTGYIPNGLDATVYYPSLDFKFRNNTGFPIKIVAWTEGNAAGQLTVQIYGSNPDGIRVETERYTQSTTQPTTVYEPSESIPRGTTKVEVTPYTGYVVDVYRCVYDANGSLISRTYENHSTYAKRDKKILYNPADTGPWGEGSGEPAPAEPVDPNTPPVQGPDTEPPTQAPDTVPPTQDPGYVEPPAPATDPVYVDPAPTPDPGYTEPAPEAPLDRPPDTDIPAWLQP